MRQIYTFIIFCLILSVNNLFSGDKNRDLFESIKTVKILSNEIQSEELVIGDEPSDETIEVNGGKRYFGGIRIINNGSLIIRNADIHISGDISLEGKALLDIDSSNINIAQGYIYEHEATASDSAKIVLRNSDFASSYHSWSIGLGGASELIMENHKLINGFITTGLYGSAQAQITNSETPGEFLCLGDNLIDIKDCNNTLVWLILPEDSKSDIAFPTGEITEEFLFEEGQGATNIPYKVSVDNCLNMNWGIISLSGSDCVIRDSKLRVAGIMFNNPDSVYVSGITNNSKYTDNEIFKSDRKFRLINTEITTWNFYSNGKSIVRMDNSFFGEFLASDSSKVFINNSICDGSGGYLGARQNSQILFIRSMAHSQVISRESGFLISSESSFNGIETSSDETSVMALINTRYIKEPHANGKSIIIDSRIYAENAPAYSKVPIMGTCRVLQGLLDITIFEGYKLFYRKDGEEDWIQFGEEYYTEPVNNGELGNWDTKGLEPGLYQVKSSLFSALSDSIDAGSVVYLGEPTGVTTAFIDKKLKFEIYPNPAENVAHFKIFLNKPGQVKLQLFTAEGKALKRMNFNSSGAGIVFRNLALGNLPPGIYFVKLSAGNRHNVKKFIVN